MWMVLSDLFTINWLVSELKFMTVSLNINYKGNHYLGTLKVSDNISI